MTGFQMKWACSTATSFSTCNHSAYLRPVPSCLQLVDDDLLVVAHIDAELEIASAFLRSDILKVLALGQL